MPQMRPKTHIHTAVVHWSRGDQLFTDNRFSRAHDWRFDGGITVPASSAPNSVRVPLSREDAVDPEEALAAALASCHMLFFLAFCVKDGLRVDDYDCEAVAEMTPNEKGKLHISKITLSPKVTYSGDKKPTAEQIAHLHHRAHEECYIANSIRAEVVVADVPPVMV